MIPKSNFFNFVVKGVGFFIIYVVFLSNFNYPGKPIELNFIRFLLPQGWSFFTKNPRDVEVVIYKESKSGIYVNQLFNNFSRTNNFGLSRLPTRISLEAGFLVTKIEDSLWYKSPFGQSYFEFGKYNRKKNIFNKPMLKGRIIVGNRERLPWSWAKHLGVVDFPIIYTKIYSY